MNEALAGLSLQQNASEPLGLEEIVRKCCDCFEGDPTEPAEPLPEWLFAISEWLTDANNADLLGMFLALFQQDPLAYGQKVCLAVGFWIRHFPFHFDGNPQLCRILERLKRLAAADESIPRPLLEELLDISTIPSFAWLRNPSTRNPAMSRHVSLNFLQSSADDIANCMSQIDHKVLSRVSVIELKRYVQSGGRLTNQTPFLERSISIFNCFSGWVQATILSKTTPAERAQVIQKFVDVGRQLHRQNNFNTLMALIGGITHSNILRLAQTQALISADISAQLNEFTELLSFSSNYSRYRHNLKEASRFRIPIMGVHLKDLLAFWHNADLENYEKSKKISQRCIGQLAYLLAHFLSVKRMQPNFGEANLELINTMKVLLDSPIVYDEVELYNLSLKREPKGKEAGEQICRQQAPTVFADWAKGVSKRADPESVDKHIKEMVDAIFKYYDDDKDGNIGRREFEQFIGNFTFVEPMEGINYDQNGLISRKEMLQYFGRKLKNGEFGQQQGHQWVDWHFLAPTICANCNKLLWMRHGSKCSRCTMSTHQNCKQNSPNSVECRRLADVGVEADAGPSNSSLSSGLGSWLNLNASSLSPRFTAFGPSSAKSPIIHQHLANGRAAQYQQQMPSTSAGKDNKNAESGTNRHIRGIRRVRTSSSSTTSDGSSSTREMGSGAAGSGGPLLPAVQTARDNFGVLRSSFHRFLRRTGAGQEGSRERETAEKTKSRKSSENTAEKSKRAESSRTDSSSKEDGNAPVGGIIEQTTARASLASEEVFEEEELGEREQQPAKMERKGKG